ncbi:taurine transport system permease protein TauC [Treponema primitia ZAS-2]|uniref:Taurine transport system permease protein TauC n=1 Tax=Treponema primitia (strain ATCC BAA-887 / DSM 12427 / ZAS-2) TaxID=545694 RepID=F5YMF2_TREPZ|nr:ABC transporter permease [Treponema primitia]AEF83647.1 taurine transport system permease protein TauC [Treponema primitia ZAS-2]
MSEIILEAVTDKCDNKVGSIKKNIDPFVWVIIKRILLLSLLISAWEIAPRKDWVDHTFLPPLSLILAEFKKMIMSGALWRHVSISLFRSIAGFSIAIGIGIPLGLVIGWYKTMSDLLTLPIEVFRNTSALAMLPVFMLFMGIGEASKFTIVAFACLWPIILNTISGIKNVDPLLIMLARSMGLTNAVMFRKIIIPAAIPSIFTGLRISSAAAVLVIIAAEMVGAKSGLGYLITNAQYSFMIPRMYVGILTTMILGVSINYLILGIENKFTSWKPKSSP